MRLKSTFGGYTDVIAVAKVQN